MNIWFTSDTHFAHKNIAGPKVSNWTSEYRNFNSVHEINMGITNCINKYVKEDDIIYHLIDCSFGDKQIPKKFNNNYENNVLRRHTWKF